MRVGVNWFAEISGERAAPYWQMTLDEFSIPGVVLRSLSH